MKDQKSSYVVRCITSYVIGGHLEYLTLYYIYITYGKTGQLIQEE